MSYLIKKCVGNKIYFYLIKSVKSNGKIKKFQVYLGSKRPDKSSMQKYNKLLEKKADDFYKGSDPLLTLISKEDNKKLEAIRRLYQNAEKFTQEAKNNYYEWFITTYTYNSNAIEGSALNLRETGMVLFENIAPKDRPLKDIKAAENHKKAFDYICSYTGGINKQFILKIHKILTEDILGKDNSGKTRKVQVYVRGSEDIPPKASHVEKDLKNLIKWYKANKKKYHPAVLASYFHAGFEYIHPFIDFNGRTGRMLLNFILMKNGYPAIDIRNKERQKYYNAIRQGIKGDLKAFVKLVIKYLNEITKYYK